MLDWKDLLAAFALLLVIEGIVPFANPAWLRRSLLQLAQLGDRELRRVGFFTMAAGLGLLFFIR